MEGSVISPDVLARYADDAALEAPGVSGLSGHAEITTSAGRTAVVLHLELGWGENAERVGGVVQERVGEYLERMANADVGSVEVVVERVGAPPARQ